VTFRDEAHGVVDLSSVRPDPSCGVFAALADPIVFKQARIKLEVVTWPNGADLDPLWMYEVRGNLRNGGQDVVCPSLSLIMSAVAVAVSAISDDTDAAARQSRHGQLVEGDSKITRAWPRCPLRTMANGQSGFIPH